MKNTEIHDTRFLYYNTLEMEPVHLLRPFFQLDFFLPSKRPQPGLPGLSYLCFIDITQEVKRFTITEPFLTVFLSISYFGRMINFTTFLALSCVFHFSESGRAQLTAVSLSGSSGPAVYSYMYY